MNFKHVGTRMAGAALVSMTALLAGCGDTDFTANEVRMPAALIEPFPADVGLYYADELRNYVHSEERWGSKWQVKLGATHVRMLDRLMQMAFRRSIAVKDLKAPPADAGIGAILRPTIEQYSFITPRDTGSDYFAVTIKYRLDVFAPDGRPADSVTFTGYGSAPVGGISGDHPMIQATHAAMRDAAAKFLVQFPDQPVAQRLRAGEPLIQVAAAPSPQTVAGEQTTGGKVAEAEEVEIEPVPILDTAPLPPS